MSRPTASATVVASSSRRMGVTLSESDVSTLVKRDFGGFMFSCDCASSDEVLRFFRYAFCPFCGTDVHITWRTYGLTRVAAVAPATRASSFLELFRPNGGGGGDDSSAGVSFDRIDVFRQEMQDAGVLKSAFEFRT
jgi:hypothetical protein